MTPPQARATGLRIEAAVGIAGDGDPDGAGVATWFGIEADRQESFRAGVEQDDFADVVGIQEAMGSLGIRAHR
ncbi:hypothetical protein ACWDBW_31750 [Streptomyces sp. NPDC001107]